MDHRHNPGASPPLTAAMQDVLRRRERTGHAPLHRLSPAQARAAYAAGADVLEIAKPTLARIESRTFEARDGAPLGVRLTAPRLQNDGPPLPVLLYFHGGGFVVGSSATHDTLCRELARAADCLVVSLDYRLAPEYRFPQAVDDAWDALAWLRREAMVLGADASRIAVGGDSAGGTLAAVCALLARDAGWPLALQLLFYPGCAPRGDTASRRRHAAGPLLDAALIDWFFEHYLRDDTNRNDWRFAPLLADDVAGVARAAVLLAECDPLLDEGIAYADRLRMAGVPVALEIYRGVVHEFIKMGRVLPEARQAHAAAAVALQQAFEAPAGPTARVA